MTNSGHRRTSLGLPIFLGSQLLAGVADSAIVFSAIAILRERHVADAQIALLQVCFAAAFVVLAPFAGPLADRRPKRDILVLGMAVRVIGALGLYVGFSPEMMFGLIGIGAALCSPAKSGLISELSAPEKLVKANGAFEACAVSALLIGTVAGSQAAASAPLLLAAVVAMTYLFSAGLSLLLPRPESAAFSENRPEHQHGLVRHFLASAIDVARDPATLIALAGSAMFWGLAATLRFLMIAWLPYSFGIESLKILGWITAIPTVGVIVGALGCSHWVRADQTYRALPVGVVLGGVAIFASASSNLFIACAALFVIGVLGGGYLVCMNSLLQERGRATTGVGAALGIQTLGDNLGMLVFLGFYLATEAGGWSPVQNGMFLGALFVLFSLLLTIRATMMRGSAGLARAPAS